MDLDSLYKLAALAAFFLGGANFMFAGWARIFWNLTFKRKQTDDEERFRKIESIIEKLDVKVSDHEEKNKYFRHNFDSVTKSLEVLISSEIKHLGEVIGLQIKNILERINEKK
jgi:hypothetical protein